MIVEILVLLAVVAALASVVWWCRHYQEVRKAKQEDLVMAKWESAERKEAAREWRAEMLAIGKGRR